MIFVLCVVFMQRQSPVTTKTLPARMESAFPPDSAVMEIMTAWIIPMRFVFEIGALSKKIEHRVIIKSQILKKRIKKSILHKIDIVISSDPECGCFVWIITMYYIIMCWLIYNQWVSDSWYYNYRLQQQKSNTVKTMQRDIERPHMNCSGYEPNYSTWVV